MIASVVVAVVAVVVLAYAIALYNRLVRSRQMAAEGWSGIDVQLKRRSDLVPNLVEAVKGYAGHERATLEEVTALRNQAQAVPQAVLAQLKEGGRIACLFMEKALGVVRLGYKIDGAVAWRYAFNASAPVLPGFAAEKEFAL